MIIYKDLLSGDELFSDAYRPKVSEDGVTYTFTTKMVSRKEGQIDDSLIGGNASAEEQSEDLESVVVSGLDVALAHSLIEKAFSDKKEFGSYLKNFFKELLTVIKAKYPEREEQFKKSSQEFAVTWMKKFSDLSFYIGASQSDNCLPLIVLWNDDGVSATVHVLKDGVLEEKF